MAGHVELCEAIKDWLNEPIQQEKFTLKFTARRLNLPIDELEGTNEAVVTVFPGQRIRITDTRGDWVVKKQVFVALQKKIVAETAAEELSDQDVVMLVSEQLEDTLKDQDFLDMSRLEETEITKAPYMVGELETDHQFTSVVELNYVGFE